MPTPPPEHDDHARPGGDRQSRVTSDVDVETLAAADLTSLTDRHGHEVLRYAMAEHVALIRRRWHGRRVVFAVRLPPMDAAKPFWLPVYHSRMGPELLEYHPALHRVRVWRVVGGEKRRTPVDLPRPGVQRLASRPVSEP